MKALRIACLLLCACGGINPGGGDNDGGQQLSALAKETLTAHNAIRAAATPMPEPALPDLKWNNDAALLALDWALQCKWQHRDPNQLGENIFASTSATTITQVVNKWASEGANYNYASNTCTGQTNGQDNVCGHYTQLVWRGTTSVGCAIQQCDTGSPFAGFTTWFFAVCDYAPAGNIVGNKPY